MQRCTPVALCVIIVVVNLEDALSAPLTALVEEILEVRVPMQDVTEMKNGVRKTSAKKMFPGYVLINMIMNDVTWYVVRT